MRFSRSLLVASIGSALVMASCGTNSATASVSASKQVVYPKNPVTIIVDHGPGGSIDIGTRLLQPFLAKELGVPVVVQNMTGANGNIAHSYVYNAKPNGYTLLAAIQPTITMGQVVLGGNYSMAKMTDVYNVYGHDPELLVSGKLDSIAQAKVIGRTQSITIGTTGVGSIHWLAAVYLGKMLGVGITIVPFSSGGGAIAAALGKQVDFTITATTAGLAAVKSGKTQGLLQFSTKASNLLPNVPILNGAKQSGYALSADIGLFAPPGTPPGVVTKLNQALNKIVSSQAFIAKAKTVGLTPDPMSSKVFSNYSLNTLKSVESDSAQLKAYAKG